MNTYITSICLLSSDSVVDKHSRQLLRLIWSMYANPDNYGGLVCMLLALIIQYC